MNSVGNQLMILDVIHTGTFFENVLTGVQIG